MSLLGRRAINYKSKLYERLGRPGQTRLGCKNYEKVCHDCNKKWFADSGGKGKRNGDRCDDCYIFYRQAVNLCTNAKTRSDKSGTEFDLDVEFILSKLREVCPRTGFPFVIGEGSDYSNRHPQTPSIDKINPSLGYTKDNIQLVCWWYNCAKQRYSDSEVLEFCRAVVNSSSI